MDTQSPTQPQAFPSLPIFPRKDATRPTRPVRVCIASPEFIGPTRNGGIGTAYTSLARSLAKAGHDVTCLYVDARGLNQDEMQKWVENYRRDGINLVPLPEVKKPFLERPIHFTKPYEVYHWLKQNDNFDVIHFSEWQAPGYYTILAKRQGMAFGRSLICLGLHGMLEWIKEANQEYIQDVCELEQDYMERQCVAQCDCLCSPSNYLINYIGSRGWQLPEKCFVQQYVLPQSARNALAQDPGGLRTVDEVVFFGRLETRKGVALFCDAMDQLPPEAARKIKMVSFLGREATVCEMPGKEYIQRRARNWTWKTEIISDKNQIEACAFLQSPHRLAVIPSLMENSPNTVYECLGSQIAFLASRVGGIPELISPDDVDRVCFEPNPKALAPMVATALLNGFKPARMAVDPDVNEKAWAAWHEGVAELAPTTPKSIEPTLWPKVSLCLTTFNRPTLLRQAVESVLDITYSNLEVVLVDDGSTKPEALAYLAQIKPEFDKRGWQIVRQENRYLGAARNTAARNATGEYLLFMDDDNVAEPHEVTVFAKAAVNSGADIVACGMKHFTGDEPPNRKEGPKTVWLPMGGSRAVGVFDNCLGDANSIVRRSVFFAAGGYTEDRNLSFEDWEFHARVVLKGYKLTVVPEFLFWYRICADSVMRTTSQYRNRMRALRPYLQDAPEAFRPLVKLVQGQQMRLAKLGNWSMTSPEMKLAVLWRSKLETARVFAKEGDKEKAVKFLIQAVKAVETSRHPMIILDALLNVGSEMRAFDTQRAAHLIGLASDLAKAIKHEASEQIAVNLLASLKGWKARSTEAPPLVSIVIPTFNKLDLTRQCLRALRVNAAGPRHEIIVVDNGSTDDTPNFLRGEESGNRLRAIFNADNTGFAAACNQGAGIARGRYIVFLNNDTEVKSNWLNPLVALAEADARIAAVGCKLLYPDGTIQHAGVALADCRGHDPLLAFHIFAKEKSSLPVVNQRRVYQAVTAACMLARKSYFDALGGFDDEYWNGYEDVDLCLRFQERGWLSVYEPASEVIHHESQSGPERFRRVTENVERFHKRWLEKASADILIDGENKSKPAPNAAIRPYSPPAEKLTSIIILAHNQLRDTQQCLTSIEKCTPLAHELILVDNGSNDGTTTFFRRYAEQHQNVRTILNGANLGFSAGNNQGLACAQGENIVLLNNDTVVTQGWLENMLATLNGHSDCGLVGPVSNNVSGPQLVTPVGYPGLEHLPKFAAQRSAEFAGKSTEAKRLVGFCLLFRRAVLEKIGGLDAQFGSGNFEDDDYCIRASLAGFKSRIALDSFVHHTGGQTFKGAKIDYRASLDRNWDVFKAKWAMPKEAAIERGYSFPTVLPQGQSLRLPLPELKSSHTPALDGRCWADKMSPVATGQKISRQVASIALPGCAMLGHLGEARELVRKRQWIAAWTAALSAIFARPYHPEAYLLLAEIAQAVGDANSARLCATTARNMAPTWAPPKQFLKGNLRGSTKPDWLKLPPALADDSAKPRISVCLIAKNEEKFIGQCLRSVKPIASQIVVVDTGSTDRTVEIAKELGAEIHPFPWCDDFSAARNAALERAAGDWILVLDADEELKPDQAGLLLREIRDSSVFGYRMPIVDTGREESGCSYVPRLFRNAPGIFFLGRVHEQAFSSIQVRCQQWGLKHALGKTILLHHGYTDAMVRSRNKIERNLRLLEKAIEELPGEPNLIMSLGLELVRSGKIEEGLDRYWEALRLMASQPEAEVTPELRETLLTQLPTHLMAAKKFGEIVQMWQSPFAKRAGMTASQHFCLGLAHMELKQPAEAAAQMRHCLAKRSRPGLSPINPEILKAGPHHCLALCLIALNDAEGAKQAFADAVAADPKSSRARFDLARFLAAQGQVGESLKWLRQLASENPLEPLVWELGAQAALSRPEFLNFALGWTAEAVEHFPKHPPLAAHRAETLLYCLKFADAAELWRKAPVSPRQRGAVVLCEVLTGGLHSNFSPAEEPAISREILNWYRQAIRVGAHGLISQIHERLETLRLTLPNFVKVLEAAHRQARQAAA